jgi:predicted HicB family RNase H-like nuclease
MMRVRRAVRKLSVDPGPRLLRGQSCAARIPQRLHRALKLYAIAAGRSLEAVVSEALEEYLAARRELP